MTEKDTADLHVENQPFKNIKSHVDNVVESPRKLFKNNDGKAVLLKHSQLPSSESTTDNMESVSTGENSNNSESESPSNSSDDEFQSLSISSTLSKEDEETIQKLESKKSRSCLTFKEAAIYILFKSNKLMTAQEIAHQAVKQRLIVTKGATPDATLSSQMNQDINTKGNKSIFMKFGAGKFSLRSRIVTHMTQCILTPEQQRLGMTLLKGSSLPYIPFDCEPNWLEIKPSQMANSGMGLYTRHPIPDKVVFSEYRGRIREDHHDIRESKESEGNSGGDAEVHPYGVSVQMADGSIKMVDGLGEDGTVLSLAPRANDAGPIYQNCILAEYSEHPGRVFLESCRDIQPGEEIFVCYGPHYWGVPKYAYFPDIKMYGNLPAYTKFYQAKKLGQSVIPKLYTKEKKLPDPFTCKSSADGMKLSFSKIKN